MPLTYLLYIYVKPLSKFKTLIMLIELSEVKAETQDDINKHKPVER